jgi:RNA polymerase sigma-70 factor (ECF subfamily)
MNCPNSETDELTLARRTAAGDQAALQIIYERYADPLFAYICHYLGGARADAEELWQDTLFAALRSIGNYRGQGRFFKWLCGIARNKIADRFRNCDRATTMFSEASSSQLASLLDAGPLPEEILARRETRVRVVEALMELPREYRLALTARYVDGQSVEEAAQLLGKSYKATESILSRARAAFRDLLLQEEKK